MRLLKKIVLFPVLVLVTIMSTSLKLIIKAECWIAGVGFLLLAIFSLIALINRMWIQLCVFGILAGFGATIMVLSANIELWLDGLMNTLKGM